MKKSELSSRQTWGAVGSMALCVSRRAMNEREAIKVM